MQRTSHFIHWIECDARATYDQGYRILAKKLDIYLDEKDSPAAIREKVHGYLEKRDISSSLAVDF